MELEESIRRLEAKNARYHSRLAAKQPAHNTMTTNGDLENLNEEIRDRDPDYEGTRDSEDIETSLTKDGEHPAVFEAGPSNPLPRTGDAPAASQEGNSRRSALDRLGQRENVAESQGTRRARRHRRSLRLRTPSPDLRDHLTAQRIERGDDLRERLSSRPNIPVAALTNGNRRTGQGCNVRRQITPPEQGVTPTTGLDVITMIHNLRNEVRDLREHGIGGSAYGVVEEKSSPFTAQILAEVCTGNFKLPNLSPYDGKADPAYHIQHYETWMTMQGVAPGAMCQAFSLTLAGPGFEWFKNLRPGSIRSFKDLKDMFLARFATSMVQKKTKMYLWSIRQEDGESLRRYLARFTEESNKVDRFDDKDAITAITEGLRTSDFLKSIVGRVPSTMAELMTRAKTFMGVEDYLDGRKGNDQSPHHRDEPSNEQGNSRKRRNRGGQTIDDLGCPRSRD